MASFLPDCTFGLLTRLSALEELRAPSDLKPDMLCASLRRLANLRVLIFSAGNPTVSGGYPVLSPDDHSPLVHSIAHLTRLEHLELRCLSEQLDLRPLSALTRLGLLSLASALCDSLLLPPLPALTHLDFWSLPQLTLPAPESLPALVSLDWKATPALPLSPEQQARLTSLRGSPDIWPHATNLRLLSLLQQDDYSAADILPSALRLPLLEELEIKLSLRESLPCGLGRLRSLTLSGPRIRPLDKCLGGAHDLTNLTELRLIGILPLGLERLPGLRSLAIGPQPMSALRAPDILSGLASLRRLRWLEVQLPDPPGREEWHSLAGRLPPACSLRAAITVEREAPEWLALRMHIPGRLVELRTPYRRSLMLDPVAP